MATMSDADLRVEHREQILGDVVYSDASEKERPFKGMLFDLSASGLCIFTHKPIEEGSEIKIVGARLWDNSRYAKVRWCRQIAGDIFRVGLTFKTAAA